MGRWFGKMGAWSPWVVHPETGRHLSLCASTDNKPYLIAVKSTPLSYLPHRILVITLVTPSSRPCAPRYPSTANGMSIPSVPSSVRFLPRNPAPGVCFA